MCCDRNAGGRIGIRVGGDIADVGAVCFLGVVSRIQIAAGCVVRVHAAGRDPRQSRMKRNWCVWQVQTRIHLGIAGKGISLFTVAEVVEVFGADDVDEFERGFAGARLCLALSRRLRLGRWGSRC